MNLFSGARRIAAILAALWIAGVFIAHVNKDKSVSLEYRVPTFVALWLASDKCAIGTDSIRAHSFKTPSGITVNAQFCFAASKADNGEMLVPYAEENKFLLMGGPYSAEVMSYTQRFVDEVFEPNGADYARADEEYSKVVWSERGYTSGALLGGLLFLWAVVWCIGWIMRGFLGIPRGQDYRISPAVVQQ
jgi:hypothetical protein